MKASIPITRFTTLVATLLLCSCGTEGTETIEPPSRDEGAAADEVPGVREDASEDASEDSSEDSSADAGAGQDPTGGGSVVPPSPKENPGVDVTYLANAGFLLTGPEGSVLIDALFVNPDAPWRAHSAQTLDALTMPRKPFDEVDVVIVTHDHNDHYDAEAVAKHLRGNPEAQLITTDQVGRDLAAKLPDFASLAERIHAGTPPSDRRIELDVGGIHFTVMNFTHGPSSKSHSPASKAELCDNIGVQFELGGTRILHLGDSLAHVTDVEAYALPEQHIDMLFVPYWMLIRPFWHDTIRTGIAPGTIVGMHFEPRTALGKHILDRGGWDSFFETLQTEFPELVVIEEPASTVHFQ